MVLVVENVNKSRLLQLQTLVAVENVTVKLEKELDTRCRNSHERLDAVIYWYIMRRSGAAEAERARLMVEEE